MLYHAFLKRFSNEALRYRPFHKITHIYFCVDAGNAGLEMRQIITEKPFKYLECTTKHVLKQHGICTHGGGGWIECNFFLTYILIWHEIRPNAAIWKGVRKGQANYQILFRGKPLHASTIITRNRAPTFIRHLRIPGNALHEMYFLTLREQSNKM